MSYPRGELLWSFTIFLSPMLSVFLEQSIFQPIKIFLVTVMVPEYSSLSTQESVIKHCMDDILFQ